MARINADDREVPRGYAAICLGKNGNPRKTYFRKWPKVRGKAAVKAAKRARQRAA